MKSCDPLQKKLTPIHAAEVPSCGGLDEALNDAKEYLVIDNEKLSMMLRAFAAERDWDQFHTPKNLATSISVEAAELLELFQWSRGEKGWDEITDPSIRARVEQELAD